MAIPASMVSKPVVHQLAVTGLRSPGDTVLAPGHRGSTRTHESASQKPDPDRPKSGLNPRSWPGSRTWRGVQKGEGERERERDKNMMVMQFFINRLEQMRTASIL